MADLMQPLLGKNPELIPVSNSEIQCYKSCKRKWYLAFYRGLHPKKQKSFGPLALGTRVHEALQAHYTDNQDMVVVYKQLLNADLMRLLETEQDTAKFTTEGELGLIMLEGYVQWLAETGADSGLDVIGAEKVLSAQLMNGRIELRGKLDLRMRRKSDGVRLFVDHKTCATFESITRTAHMSEQGMMYQLLETLNTGEDERCDGLIYNMLRKVKRTANARPPFYERLEVHFNKKTMYAFWDRLHGTLSDMLRTRQLLDDGATHTSVAYPTPTQDCSWKCEFVAVCPLFDDGSAAEELIEAYYEAGDPYARYDDKDAS